MIDYHAVVDGTECFSKFAGHHCTPSQWQWGGIRGTAKVIVICGVEPGKEDSESGGGPRVGAVIGELAWKETAKHDSISISRQFGSYWQSARPHAMRLYSTVYNPT